jgi:hypothetical protein
VASAARQVREMKGSILDPDAAEVLAGIIERS